MFIIIGGDGKEYGPVSAEQVRTWLANGRASLQTKAKYAGTDDWHTLGEYTEFVGSNPPVGSPPPVAAGAVFAVATLAGRGQRLAAVILDSIIACVFLLPGWGMLLGGGASHGGRGNAGMVVFGIVIMGLAGVALLIIQIYLLAKYGQTMGKKIMKIKIVDHADDTNPGLVKTLLLRGIVNGIIGAIPILGGVYALVDILFIFREDKRCIHDLIAGTKVVVA